MTTNSDGPIARTTSALRSIIGMSIKGGFLQHDGILILSNFVARETWLSPIATKTGGSSPRTGVHLYCCNMRLGIRTDWYTHMDLTDSSMTLFCHKSREMDSEA